MDSKELAYAKQGALAASKWDTYQTIIRRCLSLEDFKDLKIRRNRVKYEKQ